MSAPSTLGGRRFAIALLVIACGMIARALEWIDGGQLVTLLRDAAAIYGLANVGGRTADAVKAAIAQRQAAAQASSAGGQT